MALIGSLGVTTAMAAGPTPSVVIEAEGVAVTTLDLEAELQKAPPDVRSSILFRKDAISQLASNLLMRRVLAKQAEAAGLATSPVNQAALRLGRDRVLSDLQLAHLDKLNQPTDAAMEQRARDLYRAETKRFEIPEQVKASHILILSSEENAEAKAAAVLEELKTGKDFAELAKVKSQDPGSSSKGGDLGFFGRSRMAKEFEDAAFALKPGQLSDVVKTQFGYHIIKVEERIEASKQPFDEVKEALLKDLSQKILTEGRIKAGEQIMGKAKAHPEAVDAFVSSQKKP